MIESLQAEKEKLTTAVKRMKQDFDKMKCVYLVYFLSVYDIEYFS